MPTAICANLAWIDCCREWLMTSCFARLIDYPLQQRDRANQIETIISDLETQLARRARDQGALGSVYEAQVFVPGKDRLPEGFPCMSSLSFQLNGGYLHLTATYRNQYYVQKAMGNFLGLAPLHRFVVREAGTEAVATAARRGLLKL